MLNTQTINREFLVYLWRILDFMSTFDTVYFPFQAVIYDANKNIPNKKLRYMQTSILLILIFLEQLLRKMRIKSKIL